MDFIEACRKFIEIDSTPANGTLEIAQYAAELCRSAGLHVEIQNESHNGIDQANVIARPTSTRPNEEFLLQTHLDTGEPGNYGLWTKTGANPFNASIYQDQLFGLGSANTKLDFLCKLKAVSELQHSKWRMPFVLVGTYGEEIGMPGVIKLIRKKMISSKLALVGEPTDLQLIHSGKGFAGVEIEIPFSDEEKNFRAQHDMGDGVTTQSRVFLGKAAHSTVPQMGDSAILKMLEYLTKLPDGIALMEVEGGISYNTVPASAVLEIDMVGGLKDSIAPKIAKLFRLISDLEKRFLAYPDSEFSPPEPTLNIGTIRTFEDYVKLGGCCRLPPSVSNEVYEEWMEILRTACQELGAVFRVTDYKQPFRTAESEKLVEVCQSSLGALGLPEHCGAQSVANEANVLSRLGITTLVFGPGRGVGNSHAPNESVKINDLHLAVQFYKNVLERICI